VTTDDWPAGVEFKYEPTLSVTESQVQAIAERLGVPTDSGHVTATLQAVRRYIGLDAALPKTTEAQRRKQDIATLNALAKGMEGLNANVRAALTRHGGGLTFAIDPLTVAAAAKEAAIELKQYRPRLKSGPEPGFARDVLMRDLGEIYERATGRHPTLTVTTGSRTKESGLPDGPWFAFLKAAVAPVPPLAKLSDTALAEAWKDAKQRAS